LKDTYTANQLADAYGFNTGAYSAGNLALRVELGILT
jgi:hypothetical protein